MNATPEDILEHFDIPARPALLVELDRLLVDPCTDTGDISALVARDVGLAAVVLRLVNAPGYGFRTPVDSLPRAVTAIGFTSLGNIVRAFELRRVLSSSGVAYQHFWQHSTEVAEIAALVAGRLMAVCNITVDQAYLAGLFHDCGVAVLMQRFPDYAAAMRLAEPDAWVDLRQEDRRYRTDHAVVGYLVARHWHLPGFICDAIRYHHEILHVEHAARAMASLLQLARHLHALSRQQQDLEWYRTRAEALEECGLGEDSLQEFAEDVLEEYRLQR